MYAITKSKMINPAHIVSIDYIINTLANADGSYDGLVNIQMSNHYKDGGIAIDAPCDRCEQIITELNEIINRCNNFIPVELVQSEQKLLN